MVAQAEVSLSYAPDLPFKYIGGDPAIDLVNTVDWTSLGPAHDRLTDYGRLTRWAEGAGIIGPRAGAVLRSRADVRPREAERTLPWPAPTTAGRLPAGKPQPGV